MPMFPSLMLTFNLLAVVLGGVAVVGCGSWLEVTAALAAGVELVALLSSVCSAPAP